MSRRILLVVTVLAAFLAPTVVSASSTRLSGMSVPADHVRDDAANFTYLSGLATQGGLLWVEPGNLGNEAFGAVLPNLWGGRSGTWAITLRRYAPALGQAMRLDPISFSGRPCP
jgi:hypothetical protein